MSNVRGQRWSTAVGPFPFAKDLRDEVRDELVGRDHRLAVEGVDDRVEPVPKRRVALEGGLQIARGSETAGHAREAARTFLLSSWFNIRTSSSYTRVAHLRDGSSMRLICCLMMTSNAVVPTKSAGEDPWASESLRIGVNDQHPDNSRRSCRGWCGCRRP